MTDWVDEVRAASAAAVPALDGEVAVRGAPGARRGPARPVGGSRMCTPRPSTTCSARRVSSWRRSGCSSWTCSCAWRTGGWPGCSATWGCPRIGSPGRWGWNRAGAVVAGGWDEDSHRMVTAYREGALAWLDAMTAPPVRARRPRPRAVAARGRAIVGGGDRLVIVEPERQLGRGALRAEIVERLGPGAVRDLFPDAPEDPPGSPSPAAGAGHRGLDLLEQAPPGAQGQGSNEWVVAASRSATGAPLLANDPHLAVLTPSIWFECHLSAPGYEASGVSLPFAPGVVIGRTPTTRGGSRTSAATRRTCTSSAWMRSGPRRVSRGAWEPLTVHREVDRGPRARRARRPGGARDAPRPDPRLVRRGRRPARRRRGRHHGDLRPELGRAGVRHRAVRPPADGGRDRLRVLPLGVARVGLAGPERRVRRRRRAHRLPVHGQVSGPPSRRRRPRPSRGGPPSTSGTAGSTSTSSRGTWTHPRGTSRPRTTGSTTTTTRT